MGQFDKEDLFRKELESLLNKYSMENYSNTPDFILANYLMDCLFAFNELVSRRTGWYNGKEI